MNKKFSIRASYIYLQTYALISFQNLILLTNRISLHHNFILEAKTSPNSLQPNQNLRLFVTLILGRILEFDRKTGNTDN